LLKIFQAHESNFLSAMDIKLVRELQEKGIWIQIESSCIYIIEN
jgi:hypothetical protein